MNCFFVLDFLLHFFLSHLASNDMRNVRGNIYALYIQMINLMKQKNVCVIVDDHLEDIYLIWIVIYGNDFQSSEVIAYRIVGTYFVRYFERFAKNSALTLTSWSGLLLIVSLLVKLSGNLSVWWFKKLDVLDG